MELLEDEELLALSLRRPSAFAVLVARYESPFLRKARTLCGDDDDARDIVQDAFVRIYRYANTFQKREGATFRSWAYRIVVHTAYTHYRARAKRGNAETRLTEEMEAIIADPRDDFARLEREEGVRSAIARMPAALGAVLRKHFLEGKSQKEIAAEEGVSVGAVKARVHRAKKAFRNLYPHSVW